MYLVQCERMKCVFVHYLQLLCLTSMSIHFKMSQMLVYMTSKDEIATEYSMNLTNDHACHTVGSALSVLWGLSLLKYGKHLFAGSTRLPQSFGRD